MKSALTFDMTGFSPPLKTQSEQWVSRKPVAITLPVFVFLLQQHKSQSEPWVLGEVVTVLITGVIILYMHRQVVVY